MPRFVHFLCHFGVFVTVNIHKTQAQCGLRNYRETQINCTVNQQKRKFLFLLASHLFDIEEKSGEENKFRTWHFRIRWQKTNNFT